MSKKVLTTSLLTLSLAGLATGVLLSNRGNFAKQSKASGERTIVFNGSTGASAKLVKVTPSL